MNFRRGRQREEPEINFIPLIDLLLVILIFLMVSTTYSHFGEMQINLPTVSTLNQTNKKTDNIEVVISQDGKVKIAEISLNNPSALEMTKAFKRILLNKKQPVVIIDADAKATHQSVVSVMEAARGAGLDKLMISTRALTK